MKSLKPWDQLFSILCVQLSWNVDSLAFHRTVLRPGTIRSYFFTFKNTFILTVGSLSRIRALCATYLRCTVSPVEKSSICCGTIFDVQNLRLITFTTPFCLFVPLYDPRSFGEIAKVGFKFLNKILGCSSVFPSPSPASSHHCWEARVFRNVSLKSTKNIYSFTYYFILSPLIIPAVSFSHFFFLFTLPIAYKCPKHTHAHTHQ